MYAASRKITIIRQWLTALLLIIPVVACCDRVREEQADTAGASTAAYYSDIEQVRQLQKLVEGNPERDARRAYEEGKTVLWFYHNRARRIIPGVKAGRQLPDAIRLQKAPGMGDTIYNMDHKAARKAFLDYAASYNREMLALLGVTKKRDQNAESGQESEKKE